MIGASLARIDGDFLVASKVAPGAAITGGGTGVAAAIVGSGNGGHTRENADAAGLDLTAVLEELEQLIPLGPLFADEG